MKRFIAYSAAGAAVMSFFGALIGERTGIGSLPFAAFAVGIILMSSAPVAWLASRVRQLEHQIASEGRVAVVEPSHPAAI
jgi:hypothetical protein